MFTVWGSGLTVNGRRLWACRGQQGMRNSSEVLRILSGPILGFKPGTQGFPGLARFSYFWVKEFKA